MESTKYTAKEEIEMFFSKESRKNKWYSVSQVYSSIPRERRTFEISTLRYALKSLAQKGELQKKGGGRTKRILAFALPGAEQIETSSLIKVTKLSPYAGKTEKGTRMVFDD